MRPGLDAGDRAELCRRVPFLDLLRQDGIEPRQNGAHYVCRLRDERTPSCHVWPPGVGRRGSMGWTWHDYGSGQSGDALGYLVDVRGLPYLDAARELARLGGWWPAGLETRPPDAPGAPIAARSISQDPPAQSRPAGPEPLPLDAQADAVEAFMSHLVDLVPDAAAEGDAYLVDRNCRPRGMSGLAYLLPGDACRPLTARLAADPRADLFLRAGLLRPAEDGKPQRLPWWGRVCLLPCCTFTGRPAYLVGRRLDWQEGDAVGKYLNQPADRGAVRLPFGLPMLATATGRPGDGRAWPAGGKAQDLLLAEGPLDALGAAVLGWPALGLLSRLQAHSPDDRHGAAARALDPLLPALLDCRRVLVVPDNDPGRKGLEGQALAARLVAWLRHAGARAEVATLADLGLVRTDDLGWEECEIKDLADAARSRKWGAPAWE